MNFPELFHQYKEESLHGRYITLYDIEPLLEKLDSNGELKIIGKSVLGKPIYLYQIGNGKIKILLWSQMHGNESTTTKSLFDLFNLLKGNTDLAQTFLNNFTFFCVPMLNPDGAKSYTRVNANQIDLNRDSQDLSQPESIVLRNLFESINPDFCYNLHDQRTIFGVADTGKPATVSFLAPSFNKEREINTPRLKAINLIAGINNILQKYIPNQIGRFDDSFNSNCIGDTFQSLGVPTVLFEAGHFQNDYLREETRKQVFISLVASFVIIFENDIVNSKIDNYLSIPQNKVVFYDFIYKNIKINYDGIEKITNFAAQYKEELIEGQICFNAYIVEIGALNGFFGHYEYDAQGERFQNESDNIPKINQKADFYLNDKVRFINGTLSN